MLLWQLGWCNTFKNPVLKESKNWGSAYASLRWLVLLYYGWLLNGKVACFSVSSWVIWLKGQKLKSDELKVEITCLLSMTWNYEYELQDLSQHPKGAPEKFCSSSFGDPQASRNLLFAFALVSCFKERELKGLCFSWGIFRWNEKTNAAAHVLWSVLVSHLQCNPEEEDRLAHDI